MSHHNPFQLKSLALWLLATTSLTFPAATAELSGKTVRVSTNASASGTEGVRVLKAPGNIFQGDVITTDRKGEAQIVFLDETRFAIGPGSKVTIDEFVYNPDRGASAVAISAVKGSFRFIGGKSSHDAYSIHTPTATIGIRGTAFDLGFGPHGETIILWQEGSGWICVVPVGARRPQQTDCHDVALGDMFTAPVGGGLRAVTPGERFGIIQQSLFYAASQGTLLSDFQMTATGGTGGRPEPARPPTFEKQHEGNGPYR